MSGYFTDFQWFGHALSTQELHDITSCKTFQKGTKITKPKYILIPIKVMLPKTNASTLIDK